MVHSSQQVMWTLYFSQFSTCFRWIYPEFVHVQIYVIELLSFVNCLTELIVWLIWQNMNKSHIFLNAKHAFLSNMLEIAFEGFEILEFFWGSMPPDPPEKGGQWPPVDRVGYSSQTCWLPQFLLKPLCYQTKCNIKITAQNMKRRDKIITQQIYSKRRHGWTNLKKIEMDCNCAF